MAHILHKTLLSEISHRNILWIFMIAEEIIDDSKMEGKKGLEGGRLNVTIKALQNHHLSFPTFLCF